MIVAVLRENVFKAMDKLLALLVVLMLSSCDIPFVRYDGVAWCELLCLTQCVH